MTALLAAVCSAIGCFYLFTAFAYRWSGAKLVPPLSSTPTGLRLARLVDVFEPAGQDAPRTVVAALAGALAGGFFATVLFAALLPTVAAAFGCACATLAWIRSSHRKRIEEAQDAWPSIIDEVRVLTSTAGMSVPAAFFAAGSRAPQILRNAFEAAHREWMLTTDFDSALQVLTDMVGDPTADAACETLLVAHQVGGGELERRLVDLANDRRAELSIRKDARAKQAAARLARWFVLLVPIGMALAGSAIGTGRSAYSRPEAQFLVAVSLASIAVCWFWAGRLLELPKPGRVFDKRQFARPYRTRTLALETRPGDGS